MEQSLEQKGADPLTVVAESPIHGTGLFARTAIPKGSFIGRYEGPRVQEDGMHVLWIHDEEGNELYGIDGQNHLRFLNHSADPNAEFEDDELFAIRDIDAGEEVTIHYGEEWDEEE